MPETSARGVTHSIRDRLNFNDDVLWKRFSARRLELIDTLDLSSKKASEQEHEIVKVADALRAEFSYPESYANDFNKLVRAAIQSVRRNRKRLLRTKHYGPGPYSDPSGEIGRLAAQRALRFSSERERPPSQQRRDLEPRDRPLQPLYRDPQRHLVGSVYRFEPQPAAGPHHLYLPERFSSHGGHPSGYAVEPFPPQRSYPNEYYRPVKDRHHNGFLGISPYEGYATPLAPHTPSFSAPVFTVPTRSMSQVLTQLLNVELASNPHPMTISAPSPMGSTREHQGKGTPTVSPHSKNACVGSSTDPALENRLESNHGPLGSGATGTPMEEFTRLEDPETYPRHIRLNPSNHEKSKAAISYLLTESARPHIRSNIGPLQVLLPALSPWEGADGKANPLLTLAGEALLTLLSQIQRSKTCQNYVTSALRTETTLEFFGRSTVLLVIAYTLLKHFSHVSAPSTEYLAHKLGSAVTLAKIVREFALARAMREPVSHLEDLAAVVTLHVLIAGCVTDFGFDAVLMPLSAVFSDIIHRDYPLISQLRAPAADVNPISVTLRYGKKSFALTYNPQTSAPPTLAELISNGKDAFGIRAQSKAWSLFDASVTPPKLLSGDMEVVETLRAASSRHAVILELMANSTTPEAVPKPSPQPVSETIPRVTLQTASQACPQVASQAASQIASEPPQAKLSPSWNDLLSEGVDHRPIAYAPVRPQLPLVSFQKLL